MVTGPVRAATAEGTVRDDVPAGVVAGLLFGTVNSLIEWYRPGGRLTGDELADAVVTMALSGLRTL